MQLGDSYHEQWTILHKWIGVKSAKVRFKYYFMTTTASDEFFAKNIFDKFLSKQKKTWEKKHEKKTCEKKLCYNCTALKNVT